MDDKAARAAALAQKYTQNTKVPEQYQNSTQELIVKMVTHEAYGNEDYKWSINDFELGNRVGRGKFGRVYMAREKKTGYIVALKTLLKKEVAKGRVERQILREIEIQTHLKHPHILQLLMWFHDDHRIYLALEYAGKGELYKYLKNSPNGHFSEHLSAKYVYQVADALHYCHQNSVIHRDIKPENLLLTINGDIKVADFGWAVHAPSQKRKTMCGTMDYIPPEMLKGEEYGIQVDIWCLGILCYEFLVGSPPFESQNSDDTYRKIRMLAIHFPDHISPGAHDLISKLLVLKSHNRMTLPDVMKHKWIVANKSINKLN